jgi:hypothetical protein
VVLLVERENAGVWDACNIIGSARMGVRGCVGYLRVSSLYSILDWPSSRRKSSNLFSSSWSALWLTWRQSFWLSRSPQLGLCAMSWPILGLQQVAEVPSWLFILGSELNGARSSSGCMRSTCRGRWVYICGGALCIVECAEVAG